MAYNRFVIALALALAACGVGVKRVDVSGTHDNLRFTVVAAKGANRACAQDLSVGPAEPEDAYSTWQVSSLGNDKCFDTLRYGELTAGTSQEAAATPLRPNLDYRVRVSGPGSMVVRDFRLTPQGLAVEPEP